MERILVISAHPDDETIGMGGTIIKHSQAGNELYWLIVTKGFLPDWSADFLAEKEKEIEAVFNFFKFKEVVRLDFPVTKLNTVPSGELASAITKVVDRIKPNIVYAPPNLDVNADHRFVFEATAVAVRSLPGCPVKEFVAYEIPTTTRFGNAETGTYFLPNHYVDVTSVFEQKLEAFKLYRDENRPFPHPRSTVGLDILGRDRGLAIGVEYAEAFSIIRRIT